TLKPGTQPAFIKLNSEVAYKLRGDNHGKLVGCWTTEIGPLNQFFHLWSYPSMAERETLRAGLATLPGWNEQYVSQVRDMMAGQENVLLNLDSEVGFRPVEGKGHVYELRRYRGTGAGIPAWAKLFKERLAAREKYSKIVGLWTSEIGKLNVAAHLWVYDDLNHRAAARAAANADPAWASIVPTGTPFLSEMESTILVPTPISPLQ
ncbi:MAG: NIPSNAP family protein, partial [Chloroflexota bacterium]